MKTIFLFAFLLLSISVFSQLNYRSGYIIMESGDTIFGKIDRLSDDQSCQKVQMIGNSLEKVKFDNKDVKAYVRGDDYFIKVSDTSRNGKRINYYYYKVINNGYLKLYQYTYQEYSNGTMTGNGIWAGSGYSLQISYILEKNGNTTLVNQKGFKKQMINYFANNKEIVEGIEGNELKYRDIEKIVQIYNDSINKNE